MAVMYAYALYQRGLVIQGYKVLEGIYRHCVDFAHSHIYPGIPEYINNRGRGMYTYLTGAASWYMLTLVTEVFGARGVMGDLELDPKLMAEQFDSEGKARICIRFAGRKLEICYHNPGRVDYGNYEIRSVRLDGSMIDLTGVPVIIQRSLITSLKQGMANQVEVELQRLNNKS